MVPAPAVLLLMVLAVAHAVSLEKTAIMRSEGVSEVERRSEDTSDVKEFEQPAEQVRIRGGHGSRETRGCLVPMWKKDDFLCLEKGETWTDDADFERKTLPHEARCKVKCPLEKWWSQVPSVTDIECFNGVWWFALPGEDPEEVVDIVCRTSPTCYCVFILVVVVLCTFCLTRWRAYKTKKTVFMNVPKPGEEGGQSGEDGEADVGRNSTLDRNSVMSGNSEAGQGRNSVMTMDSAISGASGSGGGGGGGMKKKAFRHSNITLLSKATGSYIPDSDDELAPEEEPPASATPAAPPAGSAPAASA